ncbi:PDZ domain-containing protein [Myxococcota bacterium]|nr:PDZ domain-containing protein [Myxococcota bacterium]
MRAKRTPLFALLLLLLSFYASVSYRYGDPGWRLRFHEAEARSPYKLTDLSILNRTILHIKEKYVDPSRVDERAMIAAALKEVEGTVAELLVDIEGDEAAPEALTLRIGATTRRFELKKIRNLWHLAFTLKDIFKFMQGELRHHRKIEDIEYAAINGVLSTLDPHSVLLKPEDYREMKMSTRGKFGGLGIVIGAREDKLTIINPIPDTPASKAGLRTGDQIVRIGMDSTVNMSLSEAVDLMRGPPGTDVTIWVLREGWSKPRKYKLTRDDIRVKSVHHKALKGGVGLVRIKNFQNTTASELAAALRALSGPRPSKPKRGAPFKPRGLILDLRGNPGGLLDQAILVSNLFIESGAIVTTVGSGDKIREPKMATAKGTEPHYPIVVLTDALSASASEIVAGALRNHQRALLLGQQTFGKGSVQVIFDNKDDSALKLTIAQYLTPGDQSIQSIGVAPHIQAQSVTIEADRSDLFALHDEYQEKKLKGHLKQRESKSEKKIVHEKPNFYITYIEEESESKEKEEKPDALIEDFEVKLAAQLILAAESGDIGAMMQAAEAIIPKARAERAALISERLKTLGVDWRSGSNPKAPKIKVKASLEGGGEVLAGEPVKLKLTIKNLTAHPLYHLYAETASDNGALDGEEILIGHLPAKEEITLTRSIKTAKSAITRRDDLDVRFKLPKALGADGATRGEEIATARLSVSVRERPQPRFALQIYLDDALGDGDGVLRMGEEAEIVVRVKNEGAHPSEAILATLQNDRENETREINLKRGRIKGAPLGPGEAGVYRFHIQAKAGPPPDQPLSFFVSVIDTEIRAATYTQIHLHPQGPKAGRAGRWGLAPKQGRAFKLYGLLGDRRPVGEAEAIEADYKIGEWYRVKAEGIYAWARTDEVKIQRGEAIKPTARLLGDADYLGPPVITFKRPDWETKRAKIKLKGEARAPYQLMDLLIFANQKKIAFAPGEGDQRIEFEQEVDLKPGTNLISIIAREGEQTSTRERIIIYRR